MKKLLFLISFIAMTTASTAQHMVVEMADSNSRVVQLENLKQITFDGTTVNIEQTDGTKSSTSMSAINTISFGDYTSIGQVRPADGELVAYISSDEIAVNCEAGNLVTIYNIVGTQVLSVRIGADYGSISIANLPKGIYIVKAGNRTAKIVRR